MASFHPSTTSTPYIHSGICATLDTMLRLASTQYASASRRNRVVTSTTFVGARIWSVDSKSNSPSSAAASDGRVKARVGSVGAIAEYRGSSSSVCKTNVNDGSIVEP